MWMVMMAAMMTASVAPMSLLYARVGRQARAEGVVFGPKVVCSRLCRCLGPRSPSTRLWAIRPCAICSAHAGKDDP